MSQVWKMNALLLHLHLGYNVSSILLYNALNYKEICNCKYKEISKQYTPTSSKY